MYTFKPVPEPDSRSRERFMRYVRKDDDGCWTWTGARRRKEYGAFWYAGSLHVAHRVMYVWTHGEPNCDLHHICENPSCVNPEHVTPSSAGQPHHRGPSPNYCARGHEFTQENTATNSRGERQCRQCGRDASRRYVEANRERVLARRRERRVRVVHDPRSCEECGEAFTPRRSDKRYCSERCRDRANSRRRYQKQKG
jgi:hypothetical protein